MSRLASLRRFAEEHRRLLAVVQLAVLALFLGAMAWALHDDARAAGRDLGRADLVQFGLGCAVLAGYYVVFVLGWMWILADWGIRISYPAALRAEMLSMVAKYVPGGVWTPAARVVAARRAGVTDAALVTSSILLEAGISAVAGVVVFVVSLAFVDDVEAPLAPVLAFGIVVALLVQPRVFRPLAGRVLRRLGYRRDLPPLRSRTLSLLLVFYAGTWVLGGFALWLLVRSVGARPAPETVVFLGGTAAIGAIVAVLAIFAPSGLGPREATMYGLLLAVAGPGQALGAVALNRLAITGVELVLLLAGWLLLRRGYRDRAARPRDAEA